jgi:hypothetical protein
MPKRDFDDRPGRNDYVPAASDHAAGVVQSDSDQLAVVVHGKRSFGSDTATGTGTVPAKGGTLQVQVRRKGGPTSGGAFVFAFTATPVR